MNLLAGDYYVVCANHATVADGDLDLSPDTNLIQNGPPDAVALLLSTDIVDSSSYEGSVLGDTPGSTTGENDPDGGSRCPDNGDRNHNAQDLSFA